jgi:hypothetical protein
MTYPRAVVKLHDELSLPLDDHAAEELVRRLDDSWELLRQRYPTISVQRVFSVDSLKRVEGLVEKAVKIDPKYRPPNFANYFRIESREDGVDFGDVARTLRAAKAVVQRSYFDPPSNEPAWTPSNEPNYSKLGYQKRAPKGIDARFAWKRPGGRGVGQHFIDLEQGWTLDHEDLGLGGPGTLPLHGLMLNSAKSHGTSVLGVVCAADNGYGGVGIAPNLASVNFVSTHGSDRPNALLAASESLPFGGVLLVEAQLLGHEVNGTRWNPLPIEVLDLEFQEIKLATSLGITVVECAGNGSVDLDTFLNEEGDYVLNTRDSGAIMVGAASSARRHVRIATSNFGQRVNCYAWGEKIVTATSLNGSINDYDKNFGQTSGAGSIIAGAALAVQGISEAVRGTRFNALEMRTGLSDPTTGTASANPATDRIGVMPNLRAIIQANQNGLTPSSATSKKKKKKKKKTKKKTKKKAKRKAKKKAKRSTRRAAKKSKRSSKRKGKKHGGKKKKKRRRYR